MGRAEALPCAQYRLGKMAESIWRCSRPGRHQSNAAAPKTSALPEDVGDRQCGFRQVERGEDVAGAGGANLSIPTGVWLPVNGDAVGGQVHEPCLGNAGAGRPGDLDVEVVRER